MRTLKPLACLIVLALLQATSAEADRNLPPWLQHALEQPEPPRHSDETPSCEIVWDEAEYEVLSDGRIRANVRFAVRIIDLKERWRAQAHASYYASSGSRPKVAAWSVGKTGEVYRYKKSEQSETRNSAYLTLETEVRTVTVDGRSKTRAGDVFAYEYSTTESTIFTQYFWRFQSDAPVALSRLSITAPEGWSIEGAFFEGAPQESRSNNTVVWEARNLPPKEYEPYSPSSAARQQHMVATISPPDGSPRRFTNLRFASWEDLAAFKARVSDPSAEPDDAIIQKASELTRECATDWEKIQALGEFAKSINYEQVTLEIGNGGGYTPRPAGDTLRVGWGDCKDKSALLRALLKAVGIESYAVAVNATDNDSVDERLPTPFYFNHCITAVEIDGSIDAPAVSEDARLGRLLFIDPTWNDSPIGEIPFEAQGGLAVVGIRGAQPLVRLPLTSPEQNRSRREIVAELMANGNLLGRVSGRLHGQPAVDERRRIARLNKRDYLESLESQFAAGGNPSPVISIVKAEDDLLGDRSYRQTIDFGFVGYGRQMQGILMIFRPAILGRVVDNPFSQSERTLPVRLRSRMLDEQTRIHIPLEFELDEFEPFIVIESDFGSYHATLVPSKDGSEIEYTRVFKILDATVPAERYPELQAFYRAVIDADQKPVVLARRPTPSAAPDPDN